MLVDIYDITGVFLILFATAPMLIVALLIFSFVFPSNKNPWTGPLGTLQTRGKTLVVMQLGDDLTLKDERWKLRSSFFVENA